jgi:hypothetical protein
VSVGSGPRPGVALVACHHDSIAGPNAGFDATWVRRDTVWLLISLWQLMFRVSTE